MPRHSSRLPLFSTPSPLSIFSKRRRLLQKALSFYSYPGCTAIILFSATTSVVLLLILFRALPGFPIPPKAGEKIRVNQWKFAAARKDYRPHSSSLLPYLPDPNIADFDKFDKFQQQFSQNTDHDTITAILPVTTPSLHELHANLNSLLSARSSLLREIIIVCPDRIISEIERAVKRMRSFSQPGSVLTVLPSSPTDSRSISVLHILSSVLTPRVLLLDSTALRDVDEISRMMLLDAASSPFPVGLDGVVVSPTNASCVSSLITAPAAYLVPPILSPKSLLAEAENGMRLDIDTWAALGERVVRISGTGFGGVVVATTARLKRPCIDSLLNVNHNPESIFLTAFYRLLEQGPAEKWLAPLRLNILLPTLEDLHPFVPTACEMAQRGAVLRIMLFSWSRSEPPTHLAMDMGCHLHFETIAPNSPMSSFINRLKRWIQAEAKINVLIYASHTLTQTLAIETSVEPFRPAGITIIRVPVEDLAFCEWMSILSVSEWKNWHRPRIDLSVITNDRPRSLARLLASLKAARYYGDPVELKINLEQTADAKTRQHVAHFRWDPGTLHVQHRVIPGGLLPAVIEAWYPHDNDSYGVLLEDDVELSPLFYAWIKMAILKYRYGPPRTRAPTLYGVSLYQPTNLELRVEGRVPFEPRMIFAEHQLLDPRTPYLSQVPCSWGAVYFPEHFVEFHDYLSLRLSEISHDISTTIIPHIRSNRWVRSWKKYFNELVYLRGYVMLYPNYDLSLATNHVEVGAHVKSRATHIHDSIKRQFEVPLMPLPSIYPTSDATTMDSLLDLPDGSLPPWDQLPVFDLWGTITSHKEIATHGQERHELVSGCPTLKGSTQFRYDAKELLCARHSAL